MSTRISRKERRVSEQRRKNYRLMKKGAALVGTTMTACSLATPLMKPEVVHAEQRAVSARTNTAAYIAELSAHAQGVASANDLYASVMIAQAIVESGWGGSSLSQSPYHNLFGIKGSYNGQTVYMNTLEYLNGQWVTMKEPFKKYPSYAQSFADNAATLRNVVIGGQYYYRGAWKSNTSSYRDATAWLTGRYATAPNYASALNTIIESYNLTRFDTPGSGNGSMGGGASTGNSGSSNSGGAATSGSTYTVARGDSVWLIANKFGISMDQLIQWNNIKNNFIYPGQVLTVKKSSQSNGGTSGGNASGNNNNTSGSSSSNNSSGSATNTSGNTYTVQSGDSVWLIANKYGISMDQLIQWNGIQNNFIYPGQKLVIKQAASGSGTATTPNNNTSNNATNNNASNSSTSKPAEGSKYTVQSGDSVWAIANKHGISMDQLIQWNGIQNNFVYPGQQLIVKNGGNAAGNTNTGTTSTGAANSNPGNAGGATTSGDKYTVQSGDSVWLVANKHGISMDQLIQWNGIQNNFIYPGQQLTVKKGTTSSTTTNTGNEKTYVVKNGESVWGIANDHKITMDQLIQWNNIQNNFIYPGQKLVVAK